MAKKKAKYGSEQEVAAIVVESLESAGWSVYQEVVSYYGGPVFDIVAVKSELTWIVEVKKSLSLTLLGQGADRMDYANFVSIAYPERGDKSEKFLHLSCKKIGLGRMEVLPSRDAYGNFGERVAIVNVPKFNPNPVLARHVNICDAQKDFCIAGKAGGGYWTPFKQSMLNVAEFVRKNPGATAKEVEAGIEHHWSSRAIARNAIISWTRGGKCPGIVLDYSRTPYRLNVSRESDE